jgi:hypothetical protein
MTRQRYIAHSWEDCWEVLQANYNSHLDRHPRFAESQRKTYHYRRRERIDRIRLHVLLCLGIVLGWCHQLKENGYIVINNVMNHEKLL